MEDMKIMKSGNEHFIDEERAKKNNTMNVNIDLPEIEAYSPYAVLARKGDYQLNMQISVDKATMQFMGAIMYLSDIKTGEPLLSGSPEIAVEKEWLLKEDLENFEKAVKRFAVDFGNNSTKRALERAKRYNEVLKNFNNDADTDDIMTVYKDVVNYAVKEAEKEEDKEKKAKKEKEKKAEKEEDKEAEKEEDKDIDKKGRRFWYDKNENTVAILATHFQSVLDILDTNYKKIGFCKKLKLAGRHMGKELIISNRSGNKGYGYNTTNNIRCYKFKILDGVLQKEESNGTL